MFINASNEYLFIIRFITIEHIMWIVMYKWQAHVYIWAWPYGQRDLLYVVWPLIQWLFCDRGTMYGWNHHDNFARSVSHSKSDSIGLIIYKGMWQYLWHRYCNTGPSKQRQLYQEGLRARIYLKEKSYDY